MLPRRQTKIKGSEEQGANCEKNEKVEKYYNEMKRVKTKKFNLKIN